MASQVKIVARYQFKEDPRKVCYLIRSARSNACYFACLFDGKATSCECPATKPCYHMKQLEEREQSRNQQSARGAAHASSEDELARIEAEVLAQIEAEQAQEPVQKSEQARLADLPHSEDEKKYSRWAQAELNGSRKPTQAPASATDIEKKLAAAGFMRH